MSNEQQHDPTVTLRLELGRVTDQRDAFKAALNTELLKVAKVAIYQAMLDADSKAADTIGCMGVEVDDLRKENASLKSLCDNLGMGGKHTITAIEAENARLKAEVERLSKPAIIGGYNLSQYIRMANSETLEFDNGDMFADMTLPERIKYIVESHASLKAEVERLEHAIVAGQAIVPDAREVQS